MASHEQLIDPYLKRWQEAGLIDAETARRLRAFEGEDEKPKDRPGLIEAAVYLGLAVIAVGVVVLVATNWEQLRPWARLSIAGIPALLALIAGEVMRRTPNPGIRRGGMVAWVLCLALFTATAAISANEAGWSEENTVLAAAMTALAVGVALWVALPSHAQVVGLAAAVFLFSVALQSRSETNNGTVPLGSSLVLFGAAGVFLAELRLFVPQSFARAICGLGIVVGAFFAGSTTGPAAAEAIAFVAGAALIALSIRRGVFVYTGLGVASLFIGMVTVILRHVDDTTVAAVALIAVGAVLLGAVLLLERFRPWMRERLPA